MTKSTPIPASEQRLNEAAERVRVLRARADEEAAAKSAEAKARGEAFVDDGRPDIDNLVTQIEHALLQAAEVSQMEADLAGISADDLERGHDVAMAVQLRLALSQTSVSLLKQVEILEGAP